MELLEAMRCAPTSRVFKPDQVPRELLVRALDAARFAPSGGNRQGWRVIVVEDPARRVELRDLYLPRWRAYTTSRRAMAGSATLGSSWPVVKLSLGASVSPAR